MSNFDRAKRQELIDDDEWKDDVDATSSTPLR